jgi:hypothetical protein
LGSSVVSEEILSWRALAEDDGLVLAAGEVARASVGDLARQFIGVWIGERVVAADAALMVAASGRQ